MTNNYTSIYKQIFEAIDRAQHVMLVMHQKPDGDTAGASLAVAHYLDIIGKPHTCFCVDTLSPTLHFLPGKEKITTSPEHWHPANAQFDLLIVFDAGDLKYSGIADYVDKLSHDFTIINIDHHATNAQYGHINLVMTTASSTCEIVHELLNSANVLNKQIATCLMTGLITDTGGFTNLATTASAITAASKLLLKGANLRQITNHTLQNRSVNTLKLWGRALERLTQSHSGIVTTVITQQDLEECGATETAIEGVANFLNSLDDQTTAKAVMVLYERTPGIIKGSLRTTHPLIDVSKLAILLGGGGHKKAAGFTVPGRLQCTNGQWSIEPTNATTA
ncbi:MAG: DHH family phosphoesterase [Candidatus Kerfeldbacteria bacterium]|nr:DHH family phosphoesterase [Candidatus Kerfeldbacteria bacterium]